MSAKSLTGRKNSETNRTLVNFPLRNGRIRNKIISGLALESEAFESGSEDAVSDFYRSAKIASEVGKKFWNEHESGKIQHMPKKKAYVESKKED